MKKRKGAIIGVFIFFFFFFSFSARSVLSDQSYPAATTFDDIENPTADDLQAVSDPTIDDFNKLSSYEQVQYLLVEYNTDFAEFFLQESDFTNAEDRVIAEQYYSEDPGHINDNPEVFTAYMAEEGIDITLTGPIIDYDEKGNLYGKNQIFNLNNFRNSPASQEYALIIDPQGNILLNKKEGADFISFTGNLKADNTGKFSLPQGTINGYAISQGKHIDFDATGEIQAGTLLSYGGITFAEPTPLVTEDKGKIIFLKDATISSAAKETNLFIYGDAIIADYSQIQGKIHVPNGYDFFVNNVGIGAMGANVELRFKDDPSEDPYVTYVKIDNDKIILNGKSAAVFFNSADFVSTTRSENQGNIEHPYDTIVKPKSGMAIIEKQEDRLSITGREIEMQFGNELYTTEDGKLYKEVLKENKEGTIVHEKTGLIDETLYANIATQAGTSVPIDIHVVEEGGVALSLEKEYAALKGEEKPTVIGTLLEQGDLGISYMLEDTEGIQTRIDTIYDNLEQGVGISTDDQEFLIGLFNGIATGGYVHAGPNAGRALDHYFAGNGEQLNVDSEMFEESKNTQDAMTQMEEEIKRQKNAGETSGKIYSKSCQCVHKEIAKEVNEEDVIVDNTEGVITSGKEKDPELFYTNHNFYLDANWKTTPEGKIEIFWSVDDLYDFKGFAGNEVITLPVLGTDEEILLPDGIAKAMATDLDLAKPFNVHTEWRTTTQ